MNRIKKIVLMLPLIALFAAPALGQAAPPGPGKSIFLDGGSAIFFREDGGAPKLYAYEIQGWKNAVYWVDPGDSLRWILPAHGTGRWRVYIEGALPAQNAGSVISIAAGSSSLSWKIASTESWETVAGTLLEDSLNLGGKEDELTVKASSFSGSAVMNLQAIILIPEKADIGMVLAARQAAILRRSKAWAEYSKGIALKEAGDAAGAMAAFSSAGKLDPSWESPWTEIALALAASGDAGGAYRARASAAELQPGNPLAAQEAILAASAAADYAAAIAWCLEAERRHEARGERAPSWVLWDAGIWSSMYLSPPDLKAAADLMGRLSDGSYPADEFTDAALYHRASISRQRGDLSEYRRFRDLFIERGKNPHLLALSAWEAASEAVDTLSDAAASSLIERAVSICSESIRSYQAIPGSKPAEHAACLYWRGEAHLLQASRRAACDDIEEASTLDPSNEHYKRRFAFALHRLATEEWVMGRPAEAHSLFLREAELYRDDQANERDRASFIAELAERSLELSRKEPLCTHRVLALIIPRTDFTDVRNHEGVGFSYTGEASSLYRKDLELDALFCAKAWEALSGGALTISFEFRELPGAVLKTVRNIPTAQGGFGFVPVTDEVLPDSASALRAELQGFDSFAWIWRAGPTPVYATGGASFHQLPSKASVMRGAISYPLEFGRIEGEAILFHELWHSFENLLSLGPTHAWLPDILETTRKAHPEWKGLTEWSWYRWAIGNILPASLRVKAAELRLDGWQTLSFRARDSR